MHLSNILVRTIKGKSSVDLLYYIPYTTKRGTEYLLTNKIATIIDYGFSHVKVRNEHFGVYNVRHYGVDPNKGRPIADAYRLLMSIFELYALLKEYDEVVKMRPLLKYFWNSFEDDEFDTFLDIDFKKLHFALPDIDKYQYLSLDGLIDHIRKNYDLTNIMTDNPMSGIKIIGCKGTDVCIPDINFQVLGSGPLHPHLLFEFYDLHKHYMKSKKLIKADELKNTYKHNYNILISKITDRYKKIFTGINKVLKVTGWKSIIETDIKTLGSSAELVNTYRLQLIHYLQMYDTLWYSVTTRNIINYVNKVYGVNADVGFKDTLIEFKNLLEKLKQDITKDYTYLTELSKKSSIFVGSPYYNNWEQLGDFIKNIPMPNID